MDFSLGQLVSTPGALETIGNSFIQACLKRYLSQDWGDLSDEDKAANYSAIKEGNDRIFAAYNTPNGKIYIITEWDRSVTTILLPSEY